MRVSHVSCVSAQAKVSAMSIEWPICYTALGLGKTASFVPDNTTRAAAHRRIADV